MANYTAYKYEDLRKFAFEIFIAIGCNTSDAEIASKVLVSADLRGVDSHGVARLSGYVRLWKKKRINATPDIKITHETMSTAVVDGDAGLGLVVAPQAMQIAIDKAKKVGTGWVSVKNSNHYGIAGYHSMMALENDMIGFSMTNASPLVAPTFSLDRMLGTNPISIAIPAGKEPPFVLDMATTTAANGKLETLMRKGQDLPDGWLQDKEGNPSNVNTGVKDGGALLPLGGDHLHGSHKGYGLGAVVDIFSAVLSGANYGPWVPPFVAFLEPAANPVGEGLGHFFGAMSIDAFRTKEEFKHHMDNWIQTFKKSNPIPGQTEVLIPGDPERRISAERMENGIPLIDAVENDLKELGKEFGVSLG
ncbi:MAG: Ldh family oxidoreductase [Flavobacteriales bacterium]|nr:Ldh family oxidoreductase [Flavobacteriales bacterium]